MENFSWLLSEKPRGTESAETRLQSKQFAVGSVCKKDYLAYKSCGNASATAKHKGTCNTDAYVHVLSKVSRQRAGDTEEESLLKQVLENSKAEAITANVSKDLQDVEQNPKTDVSFTNSSTTNDGGFEQTSDSEVMLIVKNTSKTQHSRLAGDRNYSKKSNGDAKTEVHRNDGGDLNISEHLENSDSVWFFETDSADDVVCNTKFFDSPLDGTLSSSQCSLPARQVGTVSFVDSSHQLSQCTDQHTVEQDKNIDSDFGMMENCIPLDNLPNLNTTSNHETEESLKGMAGFTTNCFYCIYKKIGC